MPQAFIQDWPYKFERFIFQLANLSLVSQVSKLIFIGASVYSEGPKDMTRMPKFVSYAGVSHSDFHAKLI
jgi:hypothetical protein